MENKFKESRFIEQIMVIGESQKFPAALVVPCFSFIKDWAKKKNIDLGDGSNASIIVNEIVKARIDKEVNTFNEGFGQWEQIKCVELLENELSVDGGELTPTLKLKRKMILDIHSNKVNCIYPSNQ